MDGMEPESPEDPDDATETEKECVLCEKVAALVGLFLGGFVCFVGIDLLLKGRLSRYIGGAVEALGDDD